MMALDHVTSSRVQHSSCLIPSLSRYVSNVDNYQCHTLWWSPLLCSPVSPLYVGSVTWSLSTNQSQCHHRSHGSEQWAGNRGQIDQWPLFGNILSMKKQTTFDTKEDETGDKFYPLILNTEVMIMIIQKNICQIILTSRFVTDRLTGRRDTDNFSFY